MANKTVIIEFLVKAKGWQEVVKIFKDELNIFKGKQNINDREIDGLYIVKVDIKIIELSEDFYKKVKKSKNIAIISSSLDKKLRNGILTEVYKVETHLRKLLLNVSDLVENFYDCFKKTYAKELAKKEDLIMNTDINPITSHLTFEDIKAILEIDLSWNHKSMTVNQLLVVMSQKDQEDMKNFIEAKIKKNTVWDEISKNVLQNEIEWSKVEGKIANLKELRNKAAHFNVLTDTDLSSAKELSKQIINRTKTKGDISSEDLLKLRNAISHNYKDLFSTFNEQMRQATKVYERQFAEIAKASNSYQFEQFRKALEVSNNKDFFTSLKRASDICAEDIGKEKDETKT